jgi:hypothetical protein
MMASHIGQVFKILSKKEKEGWGEVNSKQSGRLPYIFIPNQRLEIREKILLLSPFQGRCLKGRGFYKSNKS